MTSLKRFSFVCILNILLYPMGFSAQTQKWTANEAKKNIGKYFFADPDSAAYFLRYVIKLKVDPDTVVAKHFNNLGTIFIARNNDSAIFYLKKSIALGTPKRKLVTKRNLAILYKNQRNYLEASKLLEEVLEGQKVFDQKGLPDTYSVIASVYSMMHQRGKAIIYLKKALELTDKNVDSRAYGNYKQNLANIYFNSKNYLYAAELYEESIKSLKATDDIKSYSIALANYGFSLFHLKRYKLSEKILREALSFNQISGDKKNEGLIYAKLGEIASAHGKYQISSIEFEKSYILLSTTKSPELLMTIARYVNSLNKQKNYQKALIIINKTEKIVDFKKASEIEILNFYEQASVTFTETKQDDRTIAALQKVIGLKDSLSIIERDIQSTTLQAKFQADEHLKKNAILKKTNQELQTQNKSIYNIYYKLIIGVVAILLLSFYLWYHFSKKNKIKQSALGLIAFENKQNLESERLIRKQQEKLLRKLDRDLKANSGSLSLKDDLLRMAEYSEKLRESGSFEKFESLDNPLQWKLFMDKFIPVNPLFIPNLAKQFPLLNQAELQFCALVKLKLTYKEISEVLNVVPECISAKRNALKKKMHFKDNADFLKIINNF